MTRTQRSFKDPVSGFSHAAGLVLGAVGSIWLLVRASDRATLAIYALSLVVLYTASSVYHLVVASERVTRALQLFDHVAIFLFVAGTSTPLLVRGLRDGERVTMLAVMWGLAAVGIVLKLVWRGAPRALYTAMYVAMGWSIVASARTLATSLSPTCLAFVVSGGLVYTLGAVVYATRWPDPKPNVFGFHEIWHLFVLGGSALHFVAIATLA